MRKISSTILEDLGYRVVEAADGTSALSLLTGSQPPHVDLLLTDVVLPGGMSGPELADRLSRHQPRLPVLFTSGYARHMQTASGDPIPEFRLLSKPYSIESLALRCRQAIDGAANVAAASD